MKTFKINKNLEVFCDWKKTRSAFKHEATLLRDGREVDHAKICYFNRTWESFEFESVLRKLIGVTEALNFKERKAAKKKLGLWKEKDEKEVTDKFKTLGMAMAVGNLIGKDTGEKNDWKIRILKAGLEGKGLIIPEDWDELSEDEKSERLNKLTGFLIGKKV